jgi:hypothetical protein
LHALIVGYTGAMPGLALAWDAKMVGQMEMLDTIIADGTDLDRRDALFAEARASTQALMRTLRATVTAHG